MAITDNENGFYMPVAPAYGGNGGFGGFGGDFGWLLLGLLFGGGMFGGGFGGFGGGYGNMMLGYDFPWLLNGQNGINNNVSDGFQNLATQNAITAVQSDLGDIQTQLCNGFAGVNATINGTAANAETAANARAMANMQQLFGVHSQVSDASAENRLAICQTNNTITSEAAATRSANAQNTQAILDKLCQLELDNKQTRINDLERQLSQAQFAASQANQNAFIAQGFADEVDQLYNRLSSCPVPSTPVFGRTPIFTCNNNGCGCGVA